MIVSPSIEGTARRLTELLPTVDLPDSFLQWQAQLLSNYSGHVFVPHGVETSTSTPTLWQAVLESSLAQLSMQAEIAELRSQNEFLKSEQQRLESEIKEAEARSREQERLIRQQQQQQQQQQSRSSSGSQKNFDNSFAPPRQFSSLTRPSSSKASTSTLNPFGLDSRSADSSSSHALGHLGMPPTPPFDRDDGILEAMRLQNEFDKEDRALSAQRADLTKSAQRLFECGICMEEMPDDSIARPDPCGHAFCRECLRGHITSRLNEHRFPILCPTCTVGKGKGKEAAGGTCCEQTVNFIIVSRCVSLEVSQSLALDLGLTDEQYSIWTEMEMVSFSVLLYCRKCVHGIRSPVPLLILG
jgi:Ring finger domain